DMVLFLRMDNEAVVRRISTRRSCSKCGELYNLDSKPPKVEGKCDKCGADLVQREDDKEATVRKRLMVYEDLTHPLISYYRTEHLFHEVDGNRPMDQVTQELGSVI